MKLYLGARVRCIQDSTVDPVYGMKGAEDIVDGVWGEGETRVVKLRHLGRTCIASRWVVVPSYDFLKSTHSRNGQPVTVRKTGDSERPYAATINIDGRAMELTYDPHGRFYSGHELPHDLMETP